MSLSFVKIVWSGVAWSDLVKCVGTVLLLCSYYWRYHEENLIDTLETSDWW